MARNHLKRWNHRSHMQTVVKHKYMKQWFEDDEKRLQAKYIKDKTMKKWVIVVGAFTVDVRIYIIKAENREDAVFRALESGLDQNNEGVSCGGEYIEEDMDIQRIY